jgi:hypothetical protein
MNGDLCNKVVTIPQYVGTCWFNAILMMILYSQNSRNLLIKNKFFIKKRNKLEEIFYDILYKYYIDPKKAITYFNIMRPEEILKEYKYKQFLYENMIKNGYFIKIFMSVFLRKIKIKHLVLDYFDNDIFIGINKYIKNYINYKGEYNLHIKYCNLNYDYIRENNRKYKSIPQYIIINLWDKNNVLMRELKNHDCINKIYNINYFKTTYKFKNLYELKDKIEFNGHTYILDSCSISNYNKKIGFAHAIAGITCENNKYIYNGWIRNTLDYNIKTAIKNPLPCELMKYDWNIHKPNNRFCLNQKICSIKNLDKTIEDKLCFSLNRGERTLIYVLSDNKICDDDKILNPQTNRCVKKDGKIGRMILQNKV